MRITNMKIADYQHPWDTKPDVFKSDYKSKRYYRLFNLKTENLYYTEKEKLLRLIEAIGHHMMCHMVEEKDGFPTYKALGYNENDIYEQKQKVISRVTAVNDYAKQLGMPPFFTDPEDTYQTAWEYYELMRFYYKEDFVGKYADLIKTSKNEFWK